MSGDKQIINLPSMCKIDYVGELYTTLKAALEKNAIAIVLDASQVTIITTPIIQIIISLAKSVQQKSGSLTIENPSEQFIDCFAKLGCSDLIKQWSSANG